MDFAPWHAPQVQTCEFRQGKVLPTRKPLLLLRLSGWLVLRLAERTFDALLLNEPPRKTRLLIRRPAEQHLSKETAPQAIRVSLIGVATPAHHSLLDLGKRNLPRRIGLLQVPDPAAEPSHILFRQ